MTRQPGTLNTKDIQKLAPSIAAANAVVIAAAIEQTFKRFEVSTRLARSHFLAQVTHESGQFQWTEELASGEDYEFREDLGNRLDGDGQRYKGRGLLMITGRLNYVAVSKALGFDFVNFPEKLAQYPHAASCAGYFWKLHNLNAPANRDDIETVTRIINGGYNGLEERRQYLTIAKSLYGI